MARQASLTVLLAAGLVVATGACAVPAWSATLAFACELSDGGKASAMTITYEGEASGTVKIGGVLGELSLPATMEITQIEVEGAKVEQTGVRAFGTAQVLMPDKAALEACIAGKRQPGETDDILGLLACRTTVEAAPADATVSLELAFQGEAADPFVYVTRTYLDESPDYLAGNGTKGGRIAIEFIPPPSCKRAVSP